MMAATLGAWFHDLSPFVVRITETFGIRWYGLSYVSSFVICGAILWLMAKRRVLLIAPERVPDALMLLVMGVIAGGRLGYILFYQPSLLWAVDATFPFWGPIEFNKGGMSSHGGMLGVIIAAWFVGRQFVEPGEVALGARARMLHVLDAAVLVAPIGLFLGRIANFVNGELLGKIVAGPGEAAPWWSVRFPQEIFSEAAPRLSGEQERALVEVLRPYVPARPSEDPLVDALSRVLDRVQGGDAALAAKLEPLVSARHPSQLYQAVAEGLVCLAVVWIVARVPRKPGVIGCWFFISYGVLRIATELYRLPDAHLTVQRIAGLSRGQWLSAAMVVVGVFVLMRCVRSASPSIGGWSKRRA